MKGQPFGYPLKRRYTLKITFKTLTPVFTGDEQAACDRLRETGLLGSLRFWGRALARGLGHKVWGDSNGGEQEFKSIDDLKNLDPATLLFGCTGWKKMFQMNIQAPYDNKIRQSGRPHVPATRHGWYLSPGLLLPWTKDVQIQHHFRKIPQGYEAFEKEAYGFLALVWQMIDRFGAVGAHQGWGYGLIKLPGFLEMVLPLPDHAQPPVAGLPDLADFVFAEYEFKDQTDIGLINLETGRGDYFNQPMWRWQNLPVIPKPIGLSLRYKLHHGRATYALNWDKAFFGGAKGAGDRKDPAGRFHASFPYRVDNAGNPDPNGNNLRFRIWAWLPGNVFGSTARGSYPDWVSAARQLRESLQHPDLWTDVAGCTRPTELYFWPLTRSSGTPAINNFSAILNPIEKRAVHLLGRSL